jgi:hypothetical protein
MTKPAESTPNHDFSSRTPLFLKKFYIIIFITFTCLIIWIFIGLTIHQKKEFRYFDASKLNGKITYMTASSGGERFMLDNSDHQYWFISYATKSSHFTHFNAAAAVGDSVQKEPFSNRLTLIKQESKRKYRFHFYKQQ